jgi:hypothetical protein
MQFSKKLPTIVAGSSTSVVFLMAVAAILSPMLLLPASAQEVEEPGHSAGHGTPREDSGSPPDPDCWGEVTSDLAQTDDGSAGIGEHSSDPVPGDADNETPRRGIGNNFQGDDTPSEHGETVSAIDGNPETNCEQE